jgi:hypothetical protein
MNGSFGILDMTVYGRQEHWEDSPEGLPVSTDPTAIPYRLMEDGSAPPSAREGRPTPQWSRLAAGHSDDLLNGGSAAEASERPCH